MTISTSESEVTAGRAESGRLLSILSAGLVVAIYEVVAAASMAALIFSGDLNSHLARGIGLALFAAIVTGAAVAVLGSLPGTVGGVQDAPSAVMAVIAANIAVSMPLGATADELFATVVATITITALLTGACLLGLGYFRLGNLVRFLPYPVVGGFLAGTGWLLVSGALAMMSGLDLTLANLPALFEPESLVRWLPGVIWAATAFLAMRRYSHPLLLPGLILAGILLFFATAWLSDATTDQLRAQGLLLGTIPEGQMWRPLSVADLELVSWSVVLRQAPGIATIAILSMIGVLLNASGLEVTYQRDMVLNRELRAAGLGNVLVAVGGGLVGFQQLSGSALAFGLKAPSRWVGLIAATLCGLVLLLGGSTLSLFPQAILGGLLFLIGFSFLYEWLVEAWYRLPHRDYAIVLVILLLTIVIGFLQAVVAGLLIAVILFVVSYSWADVVRAELDGVTYHSRVARSRRQRRLLDQAGQQLYILQLQGFIFFGTANSIHEQVRRRLDDLNGPPVRLVILDFSRVTGLDSTASFSFAKLIQSAASKEVRLAITAPSSTIWRQLIQAGLCEPGDGFVIFSTLDKGAEWCEEQLLASLDAARDETRLSLSEQLAEVLDDPTGISGLMGYLERLEVDAGFHLTNEGDLSDTLYFVERGRVTAQLSQEGGEPIRLEAMGSGHVVGEIGFLLGIERTADVVADEPSVIYRLSLADLPKMSTENPQAAAALHRLVATLLAERVTHLTAVVEAAERG